MPTVSFLGRILPDYITVNVPSLPEARLVNTANGSVWTYHTRIIDSQVTVDCHIVGAWDENISFVKAYDLVRIAADMISFRIGHALYVLFDAFIDEKGRRSHFGLVLDDLSPLCTAFSLPPEPTDSFMDMYKILANDHLLYLAFNDLVSAVTVPHYSLINCARAIDGLRHAIALPGSSRADGWERLRSNLRVQKSYLKPITDHSIAPRHGERAHFPTMISDDIVRRSWVIMNRFLEFRKRGNSPLSVDEFPWLS